VTAQIKLLILGLLIVATTMEVSGDTIIRNGLGQATVGGKALYFLAGAILLFGYGLVLNLAPLPFERVAGIYIATLFVVWQIISFFAFRAVPNVPILIDGALIVSGGLIVAFAGASGEA